MIPPRPVTVDDLERDRVLSQRIALFRWIEPKHLDVPEGEGSEGFLMFAQQGQHCDTACKTQAEVTGCYQSCSRSITTRHPETNLFAY